MVYQSIDVHHERTFGTSGTSKRKDIVTSSDSFRWIVKGFDEFWSYMCGVDEYIEEFWHLYECYTRLRRPFRGRSRTFCGFTLVSPN
jgi:hypothetical protein